MHRSSRRTRVPPPLWSEAHVYTTERGVRVESKRKNVGYGFTYYTLEGGPEAVEATTREILNRFPNDPYGTRFERPTEIEPGIVRVIGSHSNTSD